MRSIIASAAIAIRIPPPPASGVQGALPPAHAPAVSKSGYIVEVGVAVKIAVFLLTVILFALPTLVRDDRPRRKGGRSVPLRRPVRGGTGRGGEGAGEQEVGEEEDDGGRAVHGQVERMKRRIGGRVEG